MGNDVSVPEAGWYPAPHADNELRYWDGTQWTAWTPESSAAAHAAAAADTAVPRRRAGLPWWGWVLIGVGALALFAAIIAVVGAALFSVVATGAGSAVAPSPSAVVEETEEPDDGRVDTPDVVGLTVADARIAIEAAGLVFDVIDGAGEDWIVATQTITVRAEPGTEVFVTAKEPGFVGAAITRFYEGSGSGVVEVDIADLAVVTFDCGACTGTTILRSEGTTPLLVNRVGAYRGERLINVYENEVTTRFTVEAEGDWTITVEDLSVVETFTGPASGSGDRVIYVASSYDVASITHDGESDFIVSSWSAEPLPPLIVNDIGPYSGTVNMIGPAFVQIESTGNWTITPGPGV